MEAGQPATNCVNTPAAVPAHLLLLHVLPALHPELTLALELLALLLRAPALPCLLVWVKLLLLQLPACWCRHRLWLQLVIQLLCTLYMLGSSHAVVLLLLYPGWLLQPCRLCCEVAVTAAVQRLLLLLHRL